MLPQHYSQTTQPSPTFTYIDIQDSNRGRKSSEYGLPFPNAVPADGHAFPYAQSPDSSQQSGAFHQRQRSNFLAVHGLEPGSRLQTPSPARSEQSDGSRLIFPIDDLSRNSSQKPSKQSSRQSLQSNSPAKQRSGNFYVSCEASLMQTYAHQNPEERFESVYNALREDLTDKFGSSPAEIDVLQQSLIASGQYKEGSALVQAIEDAKEDFIS